MSISERETIRRQVHLISDNGTPKKDRRHHHKGGKVGAFPKKFIRGVDIIAIVSGPHAGEIIQTEASEFYLNFEAGSRNGAALYKRTFNDLTSRFYFRCLQIDWANQ